MKKANEKAIFTLEWRIQNLAERLDVTIDECLIQYDVRKKMRILKPY